MEKNVGNFFGKFRKKNFPLFSEISTEISPEFLRKFPRNFPRENLGVFADFRCANVCMWIAIPGNFGEKFPEIPGKFSWNFRKNFPHFFRKKKFPTKNFPEI